MSSSSESRVETSRKSGGADKDGVIPLWCMNSADGAILFAFRLLQNKNAPARRAMRITAPMTPPAMGPAFEEEAARTVGVTLIGGDVSALDCVGVGLEGKVIEEAGSCGDKSVSVAVGAPVDESDKSSVGLGKTIGVASDCEGYWQQVSITSDLK